MNKTTENEVMKTYEKPNVEAIDIQVEGTILNNSLEFELDPEEEDDWA